MPRRAVIPIAAVAALLSCAGCIVTTSTYDAKVREVEVLRDAYASSNREISRLAGEVEALSKQVAGQKTAIQGLSSRGEGCKVELALEKPETTGRTRELANLRGTTKAKEDPVARPAE